MGLTPRPSVKQEEFLCDEDEGGSGERGSDSDLRAFATVAHNGGRKPCRLVANG